MPDGIKKYQVYYIILPRILFELFVNIMIFATKNTVHQNFNKPTKRSTYGEFMEC